MAEAPGARRPDDALADARLGALSSDVVSAYVAGLTPKEIAEIYVLDLASVEELIRTSGARPPASRRWLRLASWRGRRDRRDDPGAKTA